MGNRIAAHLQHVIVAILLVAFALNTNAAIKHVWAGATGKGTGDNWNDAYPDIPSTLVRGNIYYIADGNYSGGEITIPLNGTNQIYLKKASITEHGSNLGWSDSYGDGVAVLGSWYIHDGSGGDTGFITFDGSYQFGFRINLTAGNNGFTIRNDSRVAGHNIPNLTFKYLEIVGPGDNVVNYPWGAGPYSRGIRIYAGLEGDPGYPNYVVSHCRFRGLLDAMYLSRADNLLVEHTELAWANGDATSHPDIVWISNSSGCVWRYNVFREFNVEGIEMSGSCNNWKVYGNLVYNFTSPVEASRFIEHYANGSYTNNQYYNNTLVNLYLGFRFMGGAPQSGHLVRNNLIYNVSDHEFAGAVHDFNWYSGSNTNDEPHSIAGGNSQPFINYSEQDFRIVGTIENTLPRNKGTSLASEYAFDRLGTARGWDGWWDMGAYEFKSGSSAAAILLNVPVDYHASTVAAGVTK